MNVNIAVPRIFRRSNITSTEYPQLIGPGPFYSAVHFIWSKFNAHNGINLVPFRHNLRDYYDESVPASTAEIDTIRGYLMSSELQICVVPVGDYFRWDKRNSVAERKCIYIDEHMFTLFQVQQTESQDSALRLVFMATLIHCLGDYITSWAQPNVDLSPKQAPKEVGFRAEGGAKTEYAFFGGLIGGNMPDGTHYESSKIRLYSPSNEREHFIIPDHVAREYYNSEYIHKFNEVAMGLQRNQLVSGIDNSIRQLELCCGYHRLVWKPKHRPPPPPPPQRQVEQGYYNQGGYQGQGQQGGGWQGYPPSPPQGGYMQQQQGGYGYSPPGTYIQGNAPGYPPPPNNYGGGQYALPPPPGLS